MLVRIDEPFPILNIPRKKRISWICTVVANHRKATSQKLDDVESYFVLSGIFAELRRITLNK